MNNPQIHLTVKDVFLGEERANGPMFGNRLSPWGHPWGNVHKMKHVFKRVSGKRERVKNWKKQRPYIFSIYPGCCL